MSDHSNRRQAKKRTNTSHIKYKRDKWKNNRKEHRLERLDQERDQLIRQHQLPSDVTIIRIRKNSHDPATYPKLYTYGCVAMVDRDTGELLVCARFVNMATCPPEKVAQYDQAISTLYHHGRARYPVTSNGPMNAMGSKKSGQMFPNGFRSGYESGIQAGKFNNQIIFSSFLTPLINAIQLSGPYRMNVQNRTPEKVEEDVARSKRLP